ncbi:MAG TPA: response regulator transcription factor, partial [Actinomycetota bacterium]|nr:response regulator transcription factor [Actinomycetota bacterium]
LDAVSTPSVVEPWCAVERKRGNQAVSIRVLVAEDAPVMRTALAALISADPALELVGTAEDAVEAIEMARATRPDVAIVDVKMPGGGGSRATREILWHSPETRVLALSARAERDCVLEMRAAGAACYLLKGMPAQQILRTIRDCALDARSEPPSPGRALAVVDRIQSPWVSA